MCDEHIFMKGCHHKLTQNEIGLKEMFVEYIFQKDCH